jgi:hypothetical protein
MSAAREIFPVNQHPISNLQFGEAPPSYEVCQNVKIQMPLEENQNSIVSSQSGWSSSSSSQSSIGSVQLPHRNRLVNKFIF